MADKQQPGAPGPVILPGSTEPKLLVPIDHPESSLSRKFGRETVNYFSGGLNNRLSWLRTDYDFLRTAFQSPDARFMILKDLFPLVQKPHPSSEEGAKGPVAFALVSHRDIAAVTGSDPFGPSEEDLIKNFDSSETRPLVLFVGLLESKQSSFSWKDFKGSPVFAVDVTPRGSYAAAAQGFIDRQLQEENTFMTDRIQITHDAATAAMYGQARSTMDWNLRNQFCSSCGQRTLAGHAGYKRLCPPTDLAGSDTPQPRPDCPSRKGISNISFPRTDPTMIAAILSADGTRVLLGRQKRYPPYWYSTLAGFIEPGESIEDSVRREVFEESGVRVGRVVIHSSQPWPYPASLMIGAIGQALPGGETINLAHDPELEDARWVPLEEVREALVHGVSNLGDAAPSSYKEGGLRLPPHTAIANQLLTAVVNGFASEGLGSNAGSKWQNAAL
ncbi:NUDIX domain-containing protein [Sodiomyces alkalinus F11]|uniref:NAD(+) diphosphatase n=1 Tax=Sodiomyces alkalinus (strain CBS 110278 / VKM F-3762 / F11) TaxID=1314773 RepID=A0A3N2PMV0_SODAK|nr:NUDIX domain-containing protein [Sodiomyces alkalinus F11]ROT35847.1 NUDIX domain-containing protein [Sodiomyces alkalinus F11]